MARLSLIDLFAGCGGMTLGFVRSGHFVPVLAVEVDPDAASTYENNLGRHVARDEYGAPTPIERVESFPEADVIIGGPPCQGFSPLNMAGVGLERRTLWREYLRAIREAEPAAFIMENVPQLLRSGEYGAFVRASEKLGYRVEGRVLNALDYGVPQARRRAIVIGMLNDDPAWPRITHAEDPTGGYKRHRTFRDAVEDLPLRPSGSNWHIGRNPRPLSIERYETIPGEGEGRAELAERRPDITPDCWLRKKTGSTDVFGRLWWDRPAFTIRTEFFKPEKGRYLHPSQHRPITVREAARCMTFPDDFVFAEQQSMTSVARQIGNAVPPVLAEAIARVVAAQILGTAAPHAESSQLSLAA